MKKVCKEMPYINEIIGNTGKISIEKVSEVSERLKRCSTIVFTGEGRSDMAGKIGLHGIQGKRVRTIYDVDYPGRNIKEAGPVLEKENEKVLIFANSGSGESLVPKQIVEDAVGYIEKTGSNFEIVLMTSRPKSPIGKIIEGKEYATIFELKGPKSEAKNTEEIKQLGIMRDVYELESLLVTQKLKEAINKGESAEAVIEEVKKAGGTVGDLVDEWVTSETYNELVETLITRKSVTVGGVGPAQMAALMAAIRLFHVKKAVHDEVYPAGPFAPLPRRGDILIPISWSGENPPVNEWVKRFRKVGGIIFTFTGNVDSTLARESQKKFILPVEPEEFYWLINFILSPIPISLALRFEERGHPLPPEVLKAVHSMTG